MPPHDVPPPGHAHFPAAHVCPPPHVTPHPPQFITGNGGDWADEPFPVPFPKGAEPAPGAVVAELVTTTRFGFMTMERDGAAWSMQAWDYDGKPITSCTLGQRKVVCAPIDRQTKP